MKNPILLKRESNFYIPFMMEPYIYEHITHANNKKEKVLISTNSAYRKMYCMGKNKKFYSDVLRRRLLKI